MNAVKAFMIDYWRMLLGRDLLGDGNTTFFGCDHDWRHMKENVSIRSCVKCGVEQTLFVRSFPSADEPSLNWRPTARTTPALLPQDGQGGAEK